MSKADALTVGLRVDVDTLRGTKHGVPNLVALLARHGVRASFFFSVGPDNMGRHLWRLLRPAFLRKMIRSKAGSLYGWQILFMGTLWPGPLIGERAAAEINATAVAGHEIGFHAWDHHRWQTRIETMPQAEIEAETRRGIDLLATITGQAVECAAAPAWRLSAAGLRARAAFPLRYASDCRGESIFIPVAPGLAAVGPPQIPVTLPTFDEVIGHGGVSRENYNALLLKQLQPGRLNVLTIHAEVEGLSCLSLFTAFLAEAGRLGIRFMALGDLLAASPIASAPMLRREIPGREGWLSWQGITVTP